MAQSSLSPSARVRIPKRQYGEKEEGDLFPIPCEKVKQRIKRLLAGTQFKVGALYLLLFHVTNSGIEHEKDCPAVVERGIAEKIGALLP